MRFFSKYPYTNAHQLNLDWIIKTVQELATQWMSVHTEFTDIQTQFKELKTFVTDYFKNLDVSKEVSDIINEMVRNGQFEAIVTPIIVNYLDNNSTPVVVNSTSQMTDTKKVYILASSFNMYYYNSSAWVDSGIKYGDGAISVTGMSNGNLIDFKNLKYGYDSEDNPVNGYTSTNYIDVTPFNNKINLVYENIQHITFYYFSSTLNMYIRGLTVPSVDEFPSIPISQRPPRINNSNFYYFSWSLPEGADPNKVVKIKIDTKNIPFINCFVGQTDSDLPKLPILNEIPAYAPSIITSPNGTNYTLTVDDAGNLTTKTI